MDFEFRHNVWVDTFEGESVGEDDVHRVLSDQLHHLAYEIDSGNPIAYQTAIDLLPQFEHAIRNGINLNQSQFSFVRSKV